MMHGCIPLGQKSHQNFTFGTGALDKTGAVIRTARGLLAAVWLGSASTLLHAGRWSPFVPAGFIFWCSRCIPDRPESFMSVRHASSSNSPAGLALLCCRRAVFALAYFGRKLNLLKSTR